MGGKEQYLRYESSIVFLFPNDRLQFLNCTVTYFNQQTQKNPQSFRNMKKLLNHHIIKMTRPEVISEKINAFPFNK